MRLLALSRHLRSLLTFPLLGLMLISPASAQTGSASGTPSTGTADAHAKSTGAPTSSNQATPKTGSNATTPTTEANSTAAQAESKSAGRQPESNPGTKTSSAVIINIDKTNQKMTVFIDGVEKYDWPVSTGRAGYSTPSGTYTPTSMNEVWYSKQWDNSPMPHSIFFMKDGHAIHGSYEVKTLGKPVSHGCVRVSPQNAATLYALVGKNGLENTQVVLTGVTPGGESKVASPSGPGFRYGQAGPNWYEPGDNYYAQPQRPRGFFGRLFGGPYYNGPQGYYRPPPAYYPPRGY
jgi:lipoprotein-anchoring transpeptidase ErfK/SrfK